MPFPVTLYLLFSDILLLRLVKIVFVFLVAGTIGSHIHFIGYQSSQFFYLVNDVKDESLILKGDVLWYIVDFNYSFSLLKSCLLSVMPSF